MPRSCVRRVVVAAAVAAASALVALPGSVAAQAAKPTKSCDSVEHRQFDFWVGHWDVYVPSGKKAGENRIEVIADGCALLEQWTGGGGATGKSPNVLRPGARRWHQPWVDSSGTLLILTGGFVDRSMVMSMSGPSPTDPAKPV